ncbi:hypothetical protein ADU76_02425 (plasmid) [Clostridium botulinum]|uniref:hypothetical protein n=1 Tax=Clostridium botulinum TaxID=1491 RepID=UPI0004DA1F10|nr:hypothetical protein [Clostridium botulinum]KEH96583.1 hypothetical protein Z953_p0163 [Clostridium botulinum D str. 16868]KOA94875.1 hypothetical protein ADU76_02425 [Clostridium botulinum]
MVTKKSDKNKPNDTRICFYCGKEKKNIGNNFYQNINPYIHDGFGICKVCVKKIINYKDIQSIFFVLHILNRPFITSVWNDIAKNDKDPWSAYIRQISSLPQYKDYTYSNGETFDNNEEQSTIIINTEENDYVDSNGMIYSKEWKGTFNKPDLNYLNEYLTSLKNDFNIVTRNHLDYARKIAKASLAVDKAYEGMLNGVNGSEKRYKDLQAIFDTLSKSAQFSENSRGSTNAGINGITEIVDKVEDKLWIAEKEEFKQDELDHLLQQFSNIEKSL